MREIIPGSLWLGNASDARDARRILDAGIAAIVDLAIEQQPPDIPRSVVYCRFPIADGAQDDPKVLRAAIETVVALLRGGVPTLVCCGAGMSRSPAIAAAAWSIAGGGGPDDRLRQVVCGHAHDVSPGLWQEVRTMCQTLMATR